MRYKAISHWSYSETHNAGYILRPMNVFCTFNFITPMWNLKKFRNIFCSLQERLEEERIFTSHMLYWDIGYNGIHIHCLGNGIKDIDKLRNKLSEIWDTLFYRKGNVYAAFYKGDKEKQIPYFKKRVANKYFKKGFSKNEALLRGWSKTGLYVNFPRVYFTKGYEGKIPYRANIFSPFTLLGDAHIREIEKYRQKIGHGFYYKGDPEKLKRFLFRNGGCFTIILESFGEKAIELFTPEIDKATEIRVKHYGSMLGYEVRSEKIVTERSYFVLLGRLHNNIVKAKGDLKISLNGECSISRPTSVTFQETTMGKLVGRPKIAMGEGKWDELFGSKTGSMFSIDCDKKTGNVLGKYLRKVFIRKGLKGVFYWEEGKLEGICCPKLVPLSKRISVKKKRIRRDTMGTLAFIFSLKKYRWVLR